MTFLSNPFFPFFLFFSFVPMYWVLWLWSLMGRGGLLNGHVVNGCPFIRLWISVGTESGGQISKSQRPIELSLGSVWILLSSNQAYIPDFCHFLTLSPLWPAVVNSENPPASSGHVVQTQTNFSTYFSNSFFFYFYDILGHFWPTSLIVFNKRSLCDLIAYV